LPVIPVIAYRGSLLIFDQWPFVADQLVCALLSQSSLVG
jgi:hypothetical protein